MFLCFVVLGMKLSGERCIHGLSLNTLMFQNYVFMKYIQIFHLDILQNYMLNVMLSCRIEISKIIKRAFHF